MRWGEHWRISRDTYLPKKSLIFQLGSIMPDWFDRHPIHRWVDTKDLFLDRVCKVAEMKPGIKRDWLLGFTAHFICDYCCLAHNDQYYDLYRHRVYEVLSQKYDKKKRKNGPKQIEKWMNAIDCSFMYFGNEGDSGSVEAGNCREGGTGNEAGTGNNGSKNGSINDVSELREKVCYAVEQCIKKLHSEIATLNSEEWSRDARIMKLDIEYSYALLKTVLRLLESFENK